MLKYTLRVVTLKNKTMKKERLLIDFENEKYEMLSTFLSSEVTQFEEWIKEDFDAVLSGQAEKVREFKAKKKKTHEKNSD